MDTYTSAQSLLAKKVGQLDEIEISCIDFQSLLVALATERLLLTRDILARKLSVRAQTVIDWVERGLLTPDATPKKYRHSTLF